MAGEGALGMGAGGGGLQVTQRAPGPRTRREWVAAMLLNAPSKAVFGAELDRVFDKGQTFLSLIG